MASAKEKLFVYFCFFVVLLTSVFYCANKDGMFEDEVVTLGLANSHYASWIYDIKDDFLGVDMANCDLTKDEVLSYLSVDQGERFDFVSVYYNQTNDVHPPLYYELINIVYSFDVGNVSLRPGLILNFILLVLILILLYLCVTLLFNNKYLAAVAVLSYGLSHGCLSDVLFIRMYILLTFFTVALIYCVIRIELSKSKGIYFLLTFTIFCGLFTQYNYIFIAFYICFFYSGYLLIRRKFKEFWLFGCSAIAGVLMLPLIFPYVFKQFSVGANGGSVSGENSIKNLLDISSWGNKFITGIKILSKSDFIVISLIALVLVVLFCGFVVKKIRLQFVSEDKLMFVFAVAILFSLCTITIVDPVISSRYFYQFLPSLSLVLVWLLRFVITCATESIKEKDKFLYSNRRKKLILISLLPLMIIIGSMGYLSYKEPDYLYKGYSSYCDVIDENHFYPSIYVASNAYKGVHDETLQFLLHADDTFIINYDNSIISGVETYIEKFDNTEKCLIFADNCISDTKSVCSILNESFGYDNSELLFSTDRIDVYLLSGRKYD